MELIDDRYVKKLVTMVVEVELEADLSDEFIRHDLEQEISCASTFSSIKSFYVSDPIADDGDTYD